MKAWVVEERLAKIGVPHPAMSEEELAALKAQYKAAAEELDLHFVEQVWNGGIKAPYVSIDSREERGVSSRDERAIAVVWNRPHVEPTTPLTTLRKYGL